jgi:DNA ligase-1
MHMDHTPFASLAELSEQLEQTRKRSELATILANHLHRLRREEVAPAVRLAIGQVFAEWDERALKISWKSVMAVVDQLISASPDVRDQVWAQAADAGQGIHLLMEQSRCAPRVPPPLTILVVYRTLEEIAQTVGRGSQARKQSLLHDLLQRASPVEAKFLVKVLMQDMRHGVSEGIMLEGIAKAAGVGTRHVRRANQLWGDVGMVALVALTKGETGLQQATVRMFRPVKPMLAQSAEHLSEAFERHAGHVALEYKLDGARVQIHRQGDEVRIYSRKLSDVTPSLPDVVAQVRLGLRAGEAILDGEAIAVDARGRPLPFQQLMRRFRRLRDIENSVKAVPVQLFLFDLLYSDGESLVDAPNEARWAALERAAGTLNLVPRLEPGSVEEGDRFTEDAHRDGHEGVMVKNLRSAYTPGGRGKSWLKLKHVQSLDLVVVAADWGYGRRHGWLSNYHLAALDADSREYNVVGKTFKGLTDAEFREMTERLLALEQKRSRGTVFVQPRVVVEVLFNEIQDSSQYESGLALRFARIARIRSDKLPGDADTLQTLRQLYDQQGQFKGRTT